MSRPVISRQLQVTEAIPASKATANEQLSGSSEICQRLSQAGGESAQTDVLAICPPPLPPSGPQNVFVPACLSVAMQQSYLSRQQENLVVKNGVNPGAILPSGSFQNCSFNFNINITNSHD